jgi:hypothetical protein
MSSQRVTIATQRGVIRKMEMERAKLRKSIARLQGKLKRADEGKTYMAA